MSRSLLNPSGSSVPLCFKGFPLQANGLRFFWLFAFRFFCLLLLLAQQWEQNYVADGAGIRQQHGEAVNANAFAAGRWQSIGKRTDIVFIHGLPPTGGEG